MNRRQFAGFSLAAIGGIFVPKFGQWYRRGSGLIVARSKAIDLPGPYARFLDQYGNEFQRAPLLTKSPGLYQVDFPLPIPNHVRQFQVVYEGLTLNAGEMIQATYHQPGHTVF